MSAVTEIGKFIKDNPELTDLQIKDKIETLWNGMVVQFSRNKKAYVPTTVICLHKEDQDNVCIAMIARDTK